MRSKKGTMTETYQTGQFSISSSKMTLSPKTTMSNSLFAMSLFRMCRLGLLLALTSRAQTPITPKGAGFCSSRSLLCGCPRLSPLGL